MAAAVVAAVILTIVLTRPGGGSASAELFAEPAGSVGQNPVTASTANESGSAPSIRPVKPSQGTNSQIPGSMPGLYGGTEHTASCDVEKQIKYLESQPAKRQAFAGVLDKAPGDVPSYLRSMTPVQLGYDTRVTNHGYKDGKAYGFQSVLQAGTAVLVDSYGVPRVRCKCGNPLTEPEALAQGAKTTGQTWPGYQPTNAVVVTPANSQIQEFTLRNPKTGQWFKRPKGESGVTGDHPSAPPKETPSGPPSSMRPSGPPSPGETVPGSPTTEPGTPPSGGSSPPGSSTGSGSSSEGGTTPETPSVPSEGTTGGQSSTGGETPGGSTPGGSTPGGSTPGGGSSGNESHPSGGGQTPAPAT
ncbi:DUF6777 domain-containing protein [Streptomyces nigrescens]|uniref:DUF6777 domain-containing protein n=1 Tax=Streptomyces nigrescens TaxID=1920 RepID=UPI0021C3E40F|nr:DUF6777 domain-containing protein [Streptomyces nigrescens]